MDQRLSSFQERAFASGIENSSPVLAQDLRAVAACFNDLARYRVPVSKSDDRSPSSDLSTGIYSMEDSAQSRETVQALAARNQSGSGSKPNFESSQFWGYEVYREDMQAEQGEAPNVQCDTDYYGPVDVSIDLDLITQNTTELYRADVSEMGPETQTMFPLFGKALAPPSTYSFQESTFARRLCRAAYERAHRMLTDPSSRKEEIHAIFKFSFCFTDIPGILGFVGGINGKGKEESLETWEAPQLHLGNAGLHYPRQTEAHIPSNWADKAPMGPKRSANAETPVPDWMTIDQIIEMTGFQGEWFDPHDVEHYLVSKGLQLDGESTWLELDVNAVPGLERTQLNAIASPAESYPDIDPSSPANVGSQTANEPVVHAAETSWNVEMAKIPDTPYMDLNPRFTEPFTNTKTGIANLAYDAASMFSSALAKGHTTAKKMVNIEKFIDSESFRYISWLHGKANCSRGLVVVHQGVCLGRTPGWRRSTIDSALTNSIQEVFQHDLIGTS